MRMIFPPHVSGRFINELTSDMNALVDSLFGEEHEGAPHRNGHFTPRMDVVETDRAYQLSLDLPGVHPEEIEIKIEEETLTIEGHRRHLGTKETEGSRHQVERVFGEFRRAFALPKAVDPDAILAEYTDGVLTVSVPKSVPAEARKVTIQRGSQVNNSERQNGSDESTPAEETPPQ